MSSSSSRSPASPSAPAAPAPAAAFSLSWRDALSLGRVSNLPTVWSNAIAAGAVAGAVFGPSALGVLIALSLMYVGGMYLNDAFDAGIDAKERPERPIPAGRVSRRAVFVYGYGMLGAATIALFLYSLAAGLLAIVLSLTIITYNIHHKGFRFSPVVMGTTRLFVYLCAAAAFLVAWPPGSVWIAGAALLSWVIGLTYVAKSENLGRVKHAWPLVFLAGPVLYGVIESGSDPWTLLFAVALTAWALYALRFLRRRGPGDVPRAVISLIAGISILDALVASAAGAPGIGLLCLGAFGATLFLQRLVAGT